MGSPANSVRPGIKGSAAMQSDTRFGPYQITAQTAPGLNLHLN